MTDIPSANSYNLPFGFDKVCELYDKSMIDYTQHYALLYAAYNAWYREVTVTSSDRKAIDALKKRVGIWNDYSTGRAMIPLKSYMKRLVDVTQRNPLMSGVNHWSGEIKNVDDWPSLIEYWYQVRCKVVHGERVESVYTWLAYETLDIFMQEIIHRARDRIKTFDFQKLREAAAQFEFNQTDSAKVKLLHQKLILKYSAMPDIWQVDMQSSP